MGNAGVVGPSGSKGPIVSLSLFSLLYCVRESFHLNNKKLPWS